MEAPQLSSFFPSYVHFSIPFGYAHCSPSNSVDNRPNSTPAGTLAQQNVPLLNKSSFFDSTKYRWFYQPIKTLLIFIYTSNYSLRKQHHDQGNHTSDSCFRNSSWNWRSLKTADARFRRKWKRSSTKKFIGNLYSNQIPPIENKVFALSLNFSSTSPAFTNQLS